MSRILDSAEYGDYIKGNSHAMSGRLSPDLNFGGVSKPITFEEENYNFFDGIDLFD